MADWEQARIELTELQFGILDGMADDYEDVEHLHLYASSDVGIARLPL